MKILVFGKDGQLGKAFRKLFDASAITYQIEYIGRAECDLGSTTKLTRLLASFQPNLVINVAAYTAVDKAEQEVDFAFKINAIAPEMMARYCAEQGATLLHYSTDYVFDGKGSEFYVESQPTGPLGVYGKSKLAGEQAVEKIFQDSTSPNARYAIFRTSWVYGMGGNFIRTILHLAKEREELKIIHDQHGVPTDANWLAQVSLALSMDDHGQLRNFPSGIYHAVPGGETTWHELACLAVQASVDAGMVVKALPDSIKPIPSDEYPMPAPRPMNSRMSTQKLQKTLRELGTPSLMSKFPQWDQLVLDYVAELAKNKLI
jgi:dTDP-4-dehydrorhamnose reductase